ncbi:MAG: RNA 2',3'-cyclic phosphodiesterase [Nitrososphaerota archaeon]|nr:RNA 2',3'-cyclic phosphodiesterase [Nitrososphaerota archaeon]
MRAFVAMDLPPSVLDTLSSFLSLLSYSGADLKIVDRENLHFTVKFLGEITDAQAREADSRLGRLDLPPFHLEIKGVGAFPDITRPRVVWAGAAGGREKLVAAARAIMGSLEGIGERDERPFQPHVTVARVRSPANNRALQELIQGNAERVFGEADINEFKLKSSRLTPDGPIYSDLGAYRLS